jgi:formate dehydrogenase major subunit
VFAIGDASNKGADIAISAIGEGKKASEMVERYINGEELTFGHPYLVKDEKTAEDFADTVKEPRAKLSCREADIRKNDFKEVAIGLSEEEAKREASRCLECGCHDYFECKLIDYANQYKVKPEKYEGKRHHHIHKDNHPYIKRNPDKCILCGLCVRFCDEVVGATALGLVDRGFDTVVKPALNMPLQDTDCISCGQCVYVCPTGALTETMMVDKQVPLKENVTETVCSSCSVGCKTRLTSSGRLLLRNLPSSEVDSLICEKGRFGFGDVNKTERLIVPLVQGKQTSFEEAMDVTNKGLLEIKNQYGADSVAVAISSRYTNEEACAIKDYANRVLGTHRVFSFGQTIGGLADVLGRDASTTTFDELDSADLIVVIGSDPYKNHAVAAMRIRRAVRKGAKLLLISTGEGLLDDIASCKLNELSEEAKEAKEMMQKANKPIFIYERNALTVDDMHLIGGIGHGGIIQLLPGANSQGLIDLGVESGDDYYQAIADGKIRGLFIFGEEVDIDFDKLDFLAVQDLYMTKTANQADVVFPAASFAEVSGSYTSTDGKVQELKPAIKNPISVGDNVNLIWQVFVPPF